MIKSIAAALVLSTATLAAGERVETKQEVDWGRDQPPVSSSREKSTSLETLAQVEQRERQRPAASGELFARVRITDRRTGERIAFVRGTVDPLLSRRLAGLEKTPPGVDFVEEDQLHVDGDFEIAIRAIRERLVLGEPDVMTQAEVEELEQRERNAGSGFDPKIEAGLHSTLRSTDAKVGADTLVPISIELREIPALRVLKVPDLLESGMIWTNLELAAARERALIERKRDMSVLQQPVVDAVLATGGRMHYASWGAGTVEADVPVEAIESLAASSDVFSIDYRAPRTEARHWFRGDDYYVATDAEDFDRRAGHGHEGIRGLVGRHPYSSRVVLAMSEECIDQDNPGFLTAGGSWNRGWYYDCDPRGVCTQGGVEACSKPHGTRVAQIMTGDFMDGQDPAMPSWRARGLTGTCEECQFFFLQDSGLDQRNKARDAACDLGVDIFQSSISSAAISCDGNFQSQRSVQTLIECGAVYVQSAGNNGGPGCTTSFPADHPWTFTVAGMMTQVPCIASSDYYTEACRFEPNSSRGGAPYDDEAGTASIIDITAPYRFANLVIPGTRSPVRANHGSGTSFSSPLVAGLMARLMDWYKDHIGTSIFFDNRMRTFMLLMGDRSTNPIGDARALNFHDERWGAGRVGLVPFDDLDTYVVLRNSTSLRRNDRWSLDVDLPEDVTFFKAVVWHDGKDYSNQPAIGLTLNPRGCSAETKAVLRYDSKAMLVYGLTADSGSLDGCTGMRITIENDAVGRSGRRRFHVAAYGATETERNF